MTGQSLSVKSITPKRVKLPIPHMERVDGVIQCPQQQGTILYCLLGSIVEFDIMSSPEEQPRPFLRTIGKLSFRPNSFHSIPLSHDRNLIAASGFGSSLYLAIHAVSPSRRRFTKVIWHHSGQIQQPESVLLIPRGSDHPDTIQARLGVCSHKNFSLYNIKPEQAPNPLTKVGEYTAVGDLFHASVSPDGSAIISVGREGIVNVHRMSGGSLVTFSPVGKLRLPHHPLLAVSGGDYLSAYASHFSADGSKFAVATDEGVVAVWDVRHSTPLKVFTTTPRQGPNQSSIPSGVRDLTFSNGISGKEIMVFTENTTPLVHLIDARTFEIEEIIHMPPENQKQVGKGLCLDPDGKSIYVARGRSVGEWNVLKPQPPHQWWLGD